MYNVAKLFKMAAVLQNGAKCYEQYFSNLRRGTMFML